MIDVLKERLVKAVNARHVFAGDKDRPLPHPSTVLRWIHRGVRTPTGRARLEAVRVGGVWYTSKEAVQRFANRLSQSKDDPSSTLGSKPAPSAAVSAQRLLEQTGY
ncbi:MAG TPA: DUF1580 domain-containing protein [Fimbriiglobus sp.]|jgi:hypothetical protein|nr:DUF1580 domain-containing protein [Fimbriiglobus sp.]